jgi:hypothetical protein
MHASTNPQNLRVLLTSWMEECLGVLQGPNSEKLSQRIHNRVHVPGSPCWTMRELFSASTSIHSGANAKPSSRFEAARSFRLVTRQNFSLLLRLVFFVYHQFGQQLFVLQTFWSARAKTWMAASSVRVQFAQKDSGNLPKQQGQAWRNLDSGKPFAPACVALPANARLARDSLRILVRASHALLR